MIHVQDVSKRYLGRQEVHALTHIELQIERGEMVSLVGPSGSGKTTLLNLIGGLDRPSSGEIFLDSQAMSQLDDDGLTALRRDKIGFIFQFFNLMPSLTCEENVALPLHLKGVARSAARERARQLLSDVGLGHRIHHQPDELSGGERQRTAIARALALDPPILLGDEPTGNLDSKTGDEILALLQDLNQRRKATVLLITHDPDVAASCPRTITLRDGALLSDVRR